MANKKVTELTSLTTIASNDIIYIVDVSDTTDDSSGSSKKTTVQELIDDQVTPLIPTLPVKATGAEINTGADDAKFATAKAIADSYLGGATSNLQSQISALPTATSVTTYTNKRTTKRVYSTTSTATLTPEISTYDEFALTAQAENLTIANHSTSTPANGDKMLITINPDATPRTFTFGDKYVAKAGVALPTTTTASKTIVLGFRWDAGLSKWNLLAKGTEV